jgi:hypothetical protein
MSQDADLDDAFAEETWPKTCSCCAHVISEDDWERLPYVGVQEGTDNIPDLELRNCGRCSSTLAIVVPRDFVL